MKLLIKIYKVFFFSIDKRDFIQGYKPKYYSYYQKIKAQNIIIDFRDLVN